MRIEIVAVGTELLLGQIADTNSAWLGEHLAEAGVASHFHQAVGDNKARIVTCAERRHHRLWRARPDPGRHHEGGDRGGHERAAGS